MLRFVNIRIFWFWQALGHAAAVRTLVSQQKFRNAEDVIRRKQLVEIRLREIERVMALEPAAQFGSNLQAINKLIARRDGILRLHILDDLRVAPGQDVKRELAHRLWTPRRRRDPRSEFESAGLALGPRSAHNEKSAQRDAQGENGCFSHVEIVTEMEKKPFSPCASRYSLFSLLSEPV